MIHTAMIPLHHSPEYSLMQPASATATTDTLSHQQNQAPRLMCKGELNSIRQPPRLSLPLKKRPYKPLAAPSSSSPVKLSVARGPKTVIKKPSRPSLSLVSSLSSLSNKPRKSVRFSKTQKTRILKKRTLTPEDRQQLWYQMNDYAAIDQDSIKNLQALQQVNGELERLNHDEYCVRGLEMKTSPHINRLRRLRANISVRAVVDAQNHQKVMAGIAAGSQISNVKKQEELAAISRRYTTKAQARARELGLIDASEIALP